MAESRVKKTLLNAKVNLIFYCLLLGLTFFSRKLFLDRLGAEFIGLTGTLQNLLGYLNLAEMGLASAVAFHLYKPLHDDNREKITQIVSVLGYYCRNIGLIVLGGGIVLSAFFPLIFSKANYPYAVIYFAFFAYLLASLIGYFINWRLTLLAADQKNYIISGYVQGMSMIKIMLQMFVAYKYDSVYGWIALEILASVASCIILNKKIDKEYSWLKASVRKGKQESHNFPEIFRSMRQIFVHKIKDFLLTQSDQLFVFVLVSLKMVAYYGNYVLIITRIDALFRNVLSGVVASVGNLVAENNMERIMKVFWELSAVRYFIAGLLAFCVYHLIEPFIVLWLGEQYVLDRTIVLLLCINLFITISRETVENFNFSYGHYADIWAAWTEGLINVGVTILCGYYWGIAGILTGKLASVIPIIVIWKPYYLFRDGFHRSYLTYWLQTFRYYGSLLLSAIVVDWLLGLININAVAGYGNWIIESLICAGAFAVVYGGCIIFFCPGGRALLARIRR